MTIFGDGDQTLAFTQIRDVAPSSRAAFSRWRPASSSAMFEQTSHTPLTALLGSLQLTPRHEVVDAYCSHEKARRLFGNEPTVDTEKGLAAMASWVRRRGARTSEPFAEIEILRSLPASWLENED